MNKSNMHRVSWAIATLTVVALTTSGLIAAPAATAALQAVAGATTVGPAGTVARQFTATGDLGRYYTKQTVTGMYRNARGRPVKVAVYDWQGVQLIFTARPKLDPSWWGNYWHDTYGLDQWAVGQAGGDTFHFMLPPAPMGSTFTALLVTEFDAGGNWQNWMDGTSTRIGQHVEMAAQHGQLRHPAGGMPRARRTGALPC